MLRFFEQVRVDAPLEEDGDMLLFQWGAYDFAGERTFQLELVRQFIVTDEDEGQGVMSQLRLTFHFPVTKATRGFGADDFWCDNLAGLGEFEAAIHASPCFRALKDVAPSRVSIDWSPV